MQFLQKIREKSDDLLGRPAATVAFLGDSVTNGCFELYLKDKNTFDTVFERHNSYAERFVRMLNTLFPRAQINLINAGISGDNAPNGAKRLARDVLPFRPDLTVVCFGLNDCMAGPEAEKREAYVSALREIFAKLQENGSEVIFMTPNLMCDYVDENIRSEAERQSAAAVCAVSKEGRLDEYLLAAKEAARDCGVKVCDCYARWQKMRAAGVDTTALLCNHINHPSREMHDLFAVSLLETIFEE